eukprot:gnl/TRDRNA2_/TRDRNA2_32467_c0_seq1.p1 gnl/TRDRNA2_/TRDRNA2_32467_c0~~gnl/TRDRNA2_/TRDRNA2_32467_c0_seq1.p1  ORF type:complete len:136 (-),score=28.73 gnl/TRDRNA2_/TRDRNA2_32467_c0_seq1:128-535(-)
MFLLPEDDSDHRGPVDVVAWAAVPIAAGAAVGVGMGGLVATGSSLRTSAAAWFSSLVIGAIVGPRAQWIPKVLRIENTFPKRMAYYTCLFIGPAAFVGATVADATGNKSGKCIGSTAGFLTFALWFNYMVCDDES